MPHIAAVIPDDRLDQMHFLAKCSCGTEGRFRQEQQAFQWINQHLAPYGEELILVHRPLLEAVEARIDERAEELKTEAAKIANVREDAAESESKADTSKTRGHQSWEHHEGRRK